MRTRIPKYRLHKGSGQALVQINGDRIYLGRYGTPESQERYRRALAEHFADPPESAVPRRPDDSPSRLSIGELILAYWRFAASYYVKDGEPTKELTCMKEALGPLRELYSLTPASDFGPKSLKVVRQHMIDVDLSRGVVNRRIGRIKRVFKWGASEELIPPSVYHGLQTVAGLRFGRTEARETEPVRPVPDPHVDAVLPYVSPPVAAMIRVQRLSGMRPCEVVLMRPCDIDRSGDIWIYEPFDHKNRWRGNRRIIAIGPKSLAVLQPYMDRKPTAFLFSPAEAEAWRRENRPAYNGRARKTPIYPSELRAREQAKQRRRNRKPKRPKRDHYDTDSYRRAVDYGIKKAKKAGVEIPHWHPNQLRHNRGTEIRKQHGVEAAQVVLGHARADVTQVYAEKNTARAIEIARESG